MIEFLNILVLGLALSVGFIHSVEAGTEQIVEGDSDCVILLHGLVRSSSSMEALESSLQRAGYDTVNVDYPSRDYPVEDLAGMAIKPALEGCGRYRTVNFVTHSLGGILVRQYLASNSIARLGRVVMLGPPNQGSEVVDSLGNMPGFTALNGDAGNQLGTDEQSVPNRLGPVAFELGVIAGTRSINWILSMIIPGEDDGKVAVTRTQVGGMTDHIVLPVTHTFMMNDEEVIHQVLYFLRNGKFLRYDEPSKLGTSHRSVGGESMNATVVKLLRGKNHPHLLQLSF